MNLENAAKDRAALYLEVAELAAARGDEDAAEDARCRAFDLQEAFFIAPPRAGENFEPGRAGRDEVREMLLQARAFWDAEEGETLRALSAERARPDDADVEAVLWMLRTRWSVAAGALSRLDADIARLDEEEIHDYEGN